MAVLSSLIYSAKKVMTMTDIEVDEYIKEFFQNLFQQTIPTPVQPTQPKKRHQPGIDWDVNKNGQTEFSQRLANTFLNNEWCSDVSFYVPLDDLIVPVHSIILAPSSPVLERLCFKSGRCHDDAIISAPDYCSSDILMIVLCYIYVGGTAELLTEANAVQVFRVADFFGLFDLRNQCERIIERMLNSKNVCAIYSDIHCMSTRLVDKCMEFMKQHTRTVLANGTAMNMNDAALFKLLAPDNPLNISYECELIMPMVVWADAMCGRRSMDTTPENRRNVMGQRVYRIHFGAMTTEMFMVAILVFGNGFFTNDEVAGTVKQIASRYSKPVADPSLSSDNECPFSSIARRKYRGTLTWYKTILYTIGFMFLCYIIRRDINSFFNPSM